MSDIETTTTGTDVTEASSGGRMDQAKSVIGQAGQALKDEAQSFAAAAQERARAEAQRRTETTTRTLGDFANAIRRAGDELGQADQGPAARLVRQAADGLENISRNLAGKQPEDLLNDVRSFARRNPAAFIGGAVLVGVALGRFVRSSQSSATQQLPFGDDIGGEAYPTAETAAYAGNEATGSEALGLAEEDGFDGEPEFAGSKATGENASALGDDLGDLEASDVDDSTSVQGQSQGAPGQRSS
jgi:hypothetical protein